MAFITAPSKELAIAMTQAQVKALREKHGIVPAFKMVDTCAAEFDAETPYYYSTYDGENEARISPA